MLKAIWNSIKRNPVINVAIIGIIAQALQNAMDTNDWDVQHIGTYMLQLALAFVARQFTVPAKEYGNLKENHQDLLKNFLQEGRIK